MPVGPITSVLQAVASLVAFAGVAAAVAHGKLVFIKFGYLWLNINPYLLKVYTSLYVDI